MSDKNKEICACTDEKVKLIFACSGGADVGNLSDFAARKMMRDGCGDQQGCRSRKRDDLLNQFIIQLRY